MSLRTAKERLVQTLAFELGGLLLVTPVYMAFFGKSGAQSLLLLTTLSAIVMIWSPLHNIAFDRADLHLTGRVASQRPHRLRLVHALSHELSATAATLPVAIWLGEHALTQALVLNVALTLFYTGYTYIFHIAFDRLWPVH